ARGSALVELARRMQVAGTPTERDWDAQDRSKSIPQVAKLAGVRSTGVEEGLNCEVPVIVIGQSLPQLGDEICACGESGLVGARCGSRVRGRSKRGTRRHLCSFHVRLVEGIDSHYSPQHGSRSFPQEEVRPE